MNIIYMKREREREREREIDREREKIRRFPRLAVVLPPLSLPFISLCIFPFPCKYSSPFSTSRSTIAMCASLNGARSSREHAEPPIYIVRV